MIDPINTTKHDYEPEDESSPCACGNPDCRIDGNDATNIRIGSGWYLLECGMKKLTAIEKPTDDELRLWVDAVTRALMIGAE